MAGRPIGSGKREGIPACPRHPRTHVVHAGTYGAGGIRRQLFYCYPHGEKRHRFTGALARQMLDSDAECDTCESHLAVHQGPTIPEHFDFTVHQAARALARVSTGTTYGDATRLAQLERGRALVGDVRQAHLTANWVETLAPLVTTPLAETHWPETIACDSTNYFRKERVSGQRVLAFSILAVWGYEAGEQTGRLWALHATHSATVTDWDKLFDQHPGTPRMVIEDQGGAAHKAAANKWPPIVANSQWSFPPSEPFLWRCEYHLRETLNRQLHNQILVMPAAFAPLADAALDSVPDWDAFRAGVVAQSYYALDQWCMRNDTLVRSQLTWRAQLPPHYSSGAVEAAIRQTKEAIEGRQLSLRNKYRTNQLFELLRAGINDLASEAAFASTLRRSLEAGAVRSRQLECVDVGTRGTKTQPSNVLPSLWR